MIIKEKSVEYYFDSKLYNKNQVIENMRMEQLGFEKKRAEINVILNDYGIYIATLKFESNRVPIKFPSINEIIGRLNNINIKNRLILLKRNIVEIKKVVKK